MGDLMDIRGRIIATEAALIRAMAICLSRPRSFAARLNLRSLVKRRNVLTGKYDVMLAARKDKESTDGE